MIRSKKPIYGKRFVGDTGHKIVHDTLHEVKRTGKPGCQIDEIDPNCIRTFDPDDFATAQKEGYEPCTYCLWTHRKSQA